MSFASFAILILQKALAGPASPSQRADNHGAFGPRDENENKFAVFIAFALGNCLYNLTRN